MGQDPTVSIYAHDSPTFRDRVAREAVGSDHTALASDQQADLETLYIERFKHVFNVAKRLADIASNSVDLPQEFQALFFEECVYRAMLRLRGDAATFSRRGHVDEIWNATIAAYSKDAFATSPIASNTSLDMIDRFVTSISLRLPDRVLFPSEEIDLTTISAFREIWNMRSWNFRTKQTSLQLETDGTITGNLTNGLTLDSAPGRFFVYRDAAGSRMKWVTDEQLSVARAHYWDDAAGAEKTGRPLYFRLQDDGSAKSIIMVPKPDKQYVVFGHVLVGTPAIESDNRNSTTNFDLLPKEFHSALWNKVAGECLFRHDRRIGRRYLEQASSLLGTLGSELDDTGFPDVDIAPVDIYHDLAFMTSDGGSVIGGM